MSASRTDRWLDTQGQADVLGVDTGTINKYRWRFGPGHQRPYPVHVEGQHRPGRHERAADEVLESALIAWDEERAGAMGRPRTRPPGVTVPQWRALADLHAGRQPLPRHLVTLTALGLTRSAAGRFVATKAGEQLLTAYPFPEPEED